MQWAYSIGRCARSVIGGGGVARLSVHCWVLLLVLCEDILMAVLAVPHNYTVVELDAGEFSFLRHEVLWQEAGVWVSGASVGLVLCR